MMASVPMAVPFFLQRQERSALPVHTSHMFRLRWESRRATPSDIKHLCRWSYWADRLDGMRWSCAIVSGAALGMVNVLFPRADLDVLLANHILFER